MINIKTNDTEFVIEGFLPQFLINEIPTLKKKGADVYTCPLLPLPAFVLACFSVRNKDNVNLSEESRHALKTLGKEATFPIAYMKEEGQIIFKIPVVPSYANLMQSLGATNKRLNIFTMPQSRIFEFYRIVNMWHHEFLPKIKIEEELENHIKSNITVTGDMESLFSIDPLDLHTLRHGAKFGKYKLNIENGMKRLKWSNIADMLLTRPKRYQDRASVTDVTSAPFGENASFKVEFVEFQHSFSQKKVEFEVLDVFTHRPIHCQMFGGFYLKQKLFPGDILYVIGKKIKKDTLYITNVLTEDEVRGLPIAPEYRCSQSNGFTNKVITNCVQELLERFHGEELFSYIHSDVSFWDSVKSLHFPDSPDNYLDSVDNLAYHELVALQLCFLENKNKGAKIPGLPKRHVENGFYDNALHSLPFELTEGQKESIKSMISKFKTSEPVDVLLSGDVGSGKSLIATLLAMYVVDNKEQVVIAGPTEVLARQLHESVMSVVNKLKDKPRVEFLSGSLSSAEQEEVKARIKYGDVDIIVGTHSVFNIDYKNLGFVIIDEQQKFGAAQREKLRDSRKDGKQPDFLSQTATPIPRSTALAFYGDIDLIQLSDKPKGRKEVITEWVKEDSERVLKNTNGRIWNLLKDEIKNGNQVFIICPAVEENQDIDFTSVKEAEKIINGLKQGLAKAIHGKTSKDKQSLIINEFKERKFPILIGSSILEVGINIPQATVMVVLNADRFGASSLHQIRGRVGRSDIQSYCFLVSDSESSSAHTRLTALVESSNGFDIALSDLGTRKEGDILGVRQSGESTLRFANFTDHTTLIDMAQDEAKRLYSSSLKKQALSDAYIFLKKEV